MGTKIGGLLLVFFCIQVNPLESQKLIALLSGPSHELAMTDAQSGHSGFYVSSILWPPNWDIYNNIYTLADRSGRPEFQAVMSYDV